MNRKERRAEAKQNHQNINSNTNQEETMNEIITIKTENQNTKEGENTMENTNQPGFFTKIKNAFIAGYRAGKAEIKEQVLEIKDTYISELEESSNPIIGHTRAAIITTFNILKKAAKSLLSLIALPFRKLDSIIDPQPTTQS